MTKHTNQQAKQLKKFIKWRKPKKIVLHSGISGKTKTKKTGGSLQWFSVFFPFGFSGWVQGFGPKFVPPKCKIPAFFGQDFKTLGGPIFWGGYDWHIGGVKTVAARPSWGLPLHLRRVWTS